MTRIAIWKTGHEIADRVALSLAKGIPNARILNTVTDFAASDNYDVNIAYGILRGTANIFDNHWFELDRGYFSPSHYDGYYRISYRGTQAKYDPEFPVKKQEWNLAPIRKYDASKPVLICGPTQESASFFWQFSWCHENGICEYKNKIIRKKGETSPIPWDDISAVVTFNSSVGWQAVMRGIPCLSDTTYSTVGSYYNTKSLDELIEIFNTRSREPMLDFCRAHQFTLAEIEQGQAWPLISRYLSVGIAEKQSVPMSQRIPFAAGLKNNFQSGT